MGDHRSDRREAIDVVAFLARSPYRVRVLETLADGPLDRADLQEEAGVPRVTLGRVLDAFGRRGWIERDGRGYRTTPTGDLIAVSLASFLDAVEATLELDEAMPWLPADLPFDLDRLADAEITVPREGDPLAPVRRAAEYLRAGDRVRVASPVVVPDALEADWRAVTEDGQTFELVLSADALEAAAADPEMAAQLREIIESGRASVFRYDGEIPYVVGTMDDLVPLALSDEQGMPRALIVTDDAVVREWAEERFDAYRREAEPVGPDRFSE